LAVTRRRSAEYKNLVAVHGNSYIKPSAFTWSDLMKLIRLPDVKEKFGFRSDSSVFAGIKDGILPPGIAISAKSKAWPDFEIDEILVARIAGKTDIDIKQIVTTQIEKRKSLA
jgi:prophage regulatory protein